MHTVTVKAVLVSQGQYTSFTTVAVYPLSLDKYSKSFQDS